MTTNYLLSSASTDGQPSALSVAGNSGSGEIPGLFVEPSSAKTRRLVGEQRTPFAGPGAPGGVWRLHGRWCPVLAVAHGQRVAWPAVPSGPPPAVPTQVSVEPRPLWLKHAARVMTLLIVVASLVFVILTLVHDWRPAASALDRANLFWLVPACVLAATATVLTAWRWGSALAAVGGRRGPPSRVIGAFFVGE